jgi:hypothetical protein
MAGDDVPVVVEAFEGLKVPIIVIVPEYVIVPLLVSVPVPIDTDGVAPSGQIVDAAIVTLAFVVLIVNLLNVDRVSVIVAAAVMLIVPPLAENVVVLPDCVQLPPKLHVPDVAVRVPVLLNVTAPVVIAPAPAVKVPPVDENPFAPQLKVKVDIAHVPAAIEKAPIPETLTAWVMTPV